MKKQFILYISFLVTSIASAQLYEVGALIGGSNYIGDIGSTKYINPNRLAFGGVAKFNFSSRITFRASGLYTKLHAEDGKAETNFRKNRGLQFSNNIAEAALGIEFSFFKYSLTKVGYTQTPYIIAQIGAVNYAAVDDSGDTKRKTSIVAPFGIGYKMKLARNIGIAFETTFRYMFNDTIDGNNHNVGAPYNFGNPDSNDWYVFTGISVVYAFGRPGCYKDNFYK